MAMHTHAGEIFFCANDSVKPSETPKQPDAANCPEIADFAGSDCGAWGRACGNDGRWARIPGFRRYLALADGRVYSSIRRKVLCGSENRPGGYLKVVVTGDDGKSVGAYVHHLIALAYHGRRPFGHHVSHLDGNNKNNVPSNLAYVTPDENEKHKLIHGTILRGEQLASSKLRASDIGDIRDALARGELHRVIASRYGVSPMAICKIANGMTWRGIGTRLGSCGILAHAGRKAGGK